MGQRDYISSDGIIDDIKGIAYIPDLSRVKGHYIFASLIVTYRYGREEDEVMGLCFKKEMVCDRAQVYPNNEEDKMIELQEKLMQKLGEGAKPFTLQFPQLSPNSVMIKGEDGDTSQMGVSYEIRLQIGDSSDRFDQIQIGLKNSSVNMSIRKSQYTSSQYNGNLNRPTAKAEKKFLFSRGKLGLECNLEKEVFYHGQDIPIHLSITNNGSKSVKLIKICIFQHCELTMVAGSYNCMVAMEEIRDGCPISPGSNLNQSFNMKPLAQICNQKKGIALDAMLSKATDETNLASSSLAESGDPNDLLGIVISYFAKITLRCSGMGGKLEVDLPFKLNHPKPESLEADCLEELKKTTAEEQAKFNKKRKKIQAQDSVFVEKLDQSIENFTY